MPNPLYVGECPVCHQGRQLIRKVRDTSEFFLRCEEYESEWRTPGEASDLTKAIRGKFANDILATGRDMENHPWASRVVNQADL